MESVSKVKVIKLAIKQVMEDIKKSSSSSSDDNDHDEDSNRLLLSKLMSQLEELEGEQEGSTKANNINNLNEEEEEDKIVKELKKVTRQNVITHCLLSVMIILTAAWQISEVSLILKLKDGVTNPLRSVGNIFKTIIKKPLTQAQKDTEASLSSSAITSDLIESTPVNDLKLPRLELPKIDLGFDAQHKMDLD